MIEICREREMQAKLGSFEYCWTMSEEGESLGLTLALFAVLGSTTYLLEAVRQVYSNRSLQIGKHGR